MRDSRQTFEAYVAVRRPRLLRLAFALTGDWHSADDLVQTALAKLYVAWPRVSREGAEDAYCRRIILNARVDESRRPWHRERPGLGHLDPETRPTDPSDRPALVVALAQLPPMQRRTVLLRHWWGLSVEETATELGIREGTVKSHCSRALARLAELLDDAYEETRR